MIKSFSAKIKNIQFPIIIEKDESGFYIVECPLLRGCYSQGKTLDEAVKNIKEAIALCLEERENQAILRFYKPKELSLHTITLR